VSFSSQNINTVILDYGSTIQATICDPKPGFVGTIHFLSPEMEVTAYGPGVNIWACGVFGYCLFISNGQLRWRNVVHGKDKYDLALAGLQGNPPGSVEALLSQMIAWDPAIRISVETALKHSCFSSLPRTDHPTPSQPGQKRGRQRS
jgi:serine/threonine protein kinase